eukprot:scaffold421345_cov48-Attheya_sp.AAC.2
MEMSAFWFGGQRWNALDEPNRKRVVWNIFVKLSRTKWRSSEVKSEKGRRKCRILILKPGLESPGRAGSKESGVGHFRQTVQDEMATKIGREVR